MPRRVGLGDGQPDQLVADDLVRDAERTLELVERPRRRRRPRHHVVAGLLVVDRVGEAALAPPIGLAVDRATGGGDAVGDDLHEGLGLRVVDVAVEDDHQFICTHHALEASLRTRLPSPAAGAPRLCGAG